MSDEEEVEVQEAKITFYAKNDTECPICKYTFRFEDIYSGGGRLNAGNVSDELHRNYKKTHKFGEIFPLVYSLRVCPNCLFAAYGEDFGSDLKESVITELKSGEQHRIRENLVRNLFPDIDFRNKRRLYEGAASYLLGMLTYEKFPPERCPTFKQGLSALRCAWLCRYLEEKEPDENYGYMMKILYRKAEFLYQRAIDLEGLGKEFISTNVTSFGPDIDQNYGYDGVVYLNGLLYYKYGSKRDPSYRCTQLEKKLIAIARLFGLGKSSKGKPSALLNPARTVYEEMKEEVARLSGGNG